jgi:hypothetical protein
LQEGILNLFTTPGTGIDLSQRRGRGLTSHNAGQRRGRGLTSHNAGQRRGRFRLQAIARHAIPIPRPAVRACARGAYPAQ